MIYEATHTSGNQLLSIAIDDISFTDQCLYDGLGVQGTVPPPTVPPATGCSEGFLKCDNGICYLATQQCDFTDSCNDGDEAHFDPSTDEQSCGKKIIYL